MQLSPAKASQAPSPHIGGQGPQSAGQLPQVSPPAQAPSPQMLGPQPPQSLAHSSTQRASQATMQQNGSRPHTQPSQGQPPQPRRRRLHAPVGARTAIAGTVHAGLALARVADSVAAVRRTRTAVQGAGIAILAGEDIAEAVAATGACATVQRAIEAAFEGSAEPVATAASAVRRADGAVFGDAADAVTADLGTDPAVAGARFTALVTGTQSVSAHIRAGAAVHGTGAAILVRRALTVAAATTAVCRAALAVLIGSAETVTATVAAVLRGRTRRSLLRRRADRRIPNRIQRRRTRNR